MGASNLQTDFSLATHCELLSAFSPLPMLAVDGPSQLVCYANPAFCILLGKRTEELVGSAFSNLSFPGPATPGADAVSDASLSLLKVYETGEAGIYARQETQTPDSPSWSYAMWPVRADDGRV